MGKRPRFAGRVALQSPRRSPYLSSVCLSPRIPVASGLVKHRLIPDGMNSHGQQQPTFDPDLSQSPHRAVPVNSR
eukprot:11218877-Lingulodinium_polyedra.AAC.1